MKSQEKQIEDLKRRLHNLQNDLAGVRERFNPIVKGEIEKVNNMNRAESVFPGFRRTTMKDARSICKYAQFRINKMLTESNDSETRKRENKENWKCLQEIVDNPNSQRRSG